MNLQRQTGSFYTPKFIAEFIVQWIAKDPSSNFSRILEPSCGDGVFIDSILELGTSKRNNYSIDLVEISVDSAKELVQKYSKYNNINIYNEDFLDFQCFNDKHYSLIIGNPPYIKRTLLSDKQVLLSKKIFEMYQSLSNTNLKNIWSSFLVRSINLLEKNGILAFVLPAELLQVDYASQLRQLLIIEFNRIEIFTFNELLFKECKGQDTIIVIAYRETNERGLFFSNIEHLENLSDLTKINFTKHNINEKKWSSHSLNSDELSLINRLLSKSLIMGDTCSSKPGIVTAANQFFILNKDNIRKYNLEKYKKPIVQKGSLVGDSIIFTEDDFKNLLKLDIPCYFVDLNSDAAIKDENIAEYLEVGLIQKLDERYKMKNRSHWFQVPYNASATPLFFFKRCHNYPKLIRNYTNVLTTDSAYLAMPKSNYDPNSILFSFYNSFTLACAELMGRYYGGGVLELTPKEFKSLPLPYTSISTKDFNKYIELFKRKKHIDEILEEFNNQILKSYFPDITDKEIITLESIRVKLVKRRHRL